MTAEPTTRVHSPPLSATALLNDAFRRIPTTGKLMVTAGVITLASGALPAILDAIRRFDAFTSDNDPYGEHDFGSLTYLGERLFWKIDYYDPSMSFGSADPSDAAQTVRVLTIMLASEY